MGVDKFFGKKSFNLILIVQIVLIILLFGEIIRKKNLNLLEVQKHMYYITISKIIKKKKKVLFHIIKTN
jgi:hypothetical protein